MKHRNPILVALNKRHHGNTVMADRRAPRGGDRNEQEELRQEYEEEEINDEEEEDSSNDLTS